MKNPFVAPSIICIALAIPLSGMASDHAAARQALAAGQILPLRVILDKVEQQQPGQVMEVELEQKNGVWIYEVKLLKDDGRLMKLKLNAKEGAVLEAKEKPALLKNKTTDAPSAR